MISEKAVKIHVEFYSFLYRIEVDETSLRNVLWNCTAVPEGFAVWLRSVVLQWDVRIVRIVDFAL